MLSFIVLLVVKAKILPRLDTNERTKSFNNMPWSMNLDSQVLLLAHHLELLLTSSINILIAADYTCGYGFYPTLWILSTALFVEHRFISSSGLCLRVWILSNCGFYPPLHSSSTASFRRADYACGCGFYPTVDSIHRSILRAPLHFVERTMPAGVDSIQLWILSTAPFFEHRFISSSGLCLRVWILSNIVDSIHSSIRRAPLHFVERENTIDYLYIFFYYPINYITAWICRCTSLKWITLC
jgi:hypothetical protein